MINKEKVLKLLNKARYYHNCLCREEKAIKICNKILKDDPENRDALLIKAGSLKYVHKGKGSFLLLTHIIEKWPDHWEAYYLIGVLLFNADEKQAMENFTKSMDRKKTFDNCIAAAQLAYFMNDETYITYLSSAQELDPPRYVNYMDKYWEWELC